MVFKSCPTVPARSTVRAHNQHYQHKHIRHICNKQHTHTHTPVLILAAGVYWLPRCPRVAYPIYTSTFAAAKPSGGPHRSPLLDARRSHSQLELLCYTANLTTRYLDVLEGFQLWTCSVSAHQHTPSNIPNLTTQSRPKQADHLRSTKCSQLHGDGMLR